MFDSLGGAPLAVQVDPAGELNSKVAESYFTHRETRVDVTQASEHWRIGRPERRHILVKRMHQVYTCARECSAGILVSLPVARGVHTKSSAEIA
jgi:hypothetical protein